MYYILIIEPWLTTTLLFDIAYRPAGYRSATLSASLGLYFRDSRCAQRPRVGGAYFECFIYKLQLTNLQTLLLKFIWWMCLKWEDIVCGDTLLNFPAKRPDNFLKGWWSIKSQLSVSIKSISLSLLDTPGNVATFIQFVLDEIKHSLIPKGGNIILGLSSLRVNNVSGWAVCYLLQTGWQHWVLQPQDPW